MVDESTEHALLVLVVLELVVLAGLFVVLAASLFGSTTLLTSVSRPVRLAALAFLAVELLIPVWVYADQRRRGEADVTWFHAAATPVLNLFGLLGYLVHRRRSDRGD